MARKSLTEILHGKTIFGDYLVLGEGEYSKKERFVLCSCKCGAVRNVSAVKLRSGRSTCCKDCAAKSERRVTNLKHGMSKSAEYNAFLNMIDRCENKNYHNYEKYGGRGITVCKEWRHSFDRFYADMGPRPSKDHSLDRINNDGNYEPGNCRWATRIEQLSNRSVTMFAEVDGAMVPVSELARQAGMKYETLAMRLKLGWSIEDAMKRPVENKKPKHSVFGKLMTASEIQKEYGVDRQRFNRRIRQGMTADQAILIDRG